MLDEWKLSHAGGTALMLNARRHRPHRPLPGLLIALLLAVACWLPLAGSTAAREAPPLNQVQAVFPGASGVGAVEGDPPAAPVFAAGRLVGYVFSTRDAVASVGYSGRPFDVLVGLDLEGHITGAELLDHNEPVLVIGVSPAALEAFIDRFAGIAAEANSRIARRTAAEGGIDGLSGATVSATLFADAILRAARAVATDRGILPPPATGARLDLDRFEPLDWPGLERQGLVSRLHLTNADIDLSLEGLGREPAPGPQDLDPAATFVDLWTALGTPAMIGGNLLGDARHRALTLELDPGDHAIVVLARGRYSVKGTGYVRTGVFDRLQVVQGGQTIPLTAELHTRLENLAIAGAPEFRELGWFVLPEATGFDPLQPWQLRLLIQQPTTAGDVLLDFTLPVTSPAALLVDAAPAAEPTGLLGRLRGAAAAPDGPLVVSAGLWLDIWAERWLDITLLVLFLGVLTQALVFQDALAQRPRLYRRFRTGFLVVTLVWLGWTMGAQLSVINVLTFVNSLLTGFSWPIFLMEPLIFVLWAYVALALLFLGRGVFCGWLCPFGALQELSNMLARRLRVPQARLPFGLNERLWPIKYIIFIGLLAVSLHAMSAATIMAEVEPFKTAINMHFLRPWPFVLYALVLLAAGLFIERFFCRYLCPLGAALAIPARLTTFRWLKRRPQCGRECHICATRCPVQAIHPTGEINPHECVYCLDCQVQYYDDHTCPPLIKRRKRREAFAAAQAQAQAAGADPLAQDAEQR
jgi:NosR/NirI family transcriptional regulator, nitrous oxide reductase regulator